MPSPFFTLQNAHVWQNNTLALRNISLNLFCGESVAILGANGAGKSTLLKLMTGALRPENRPNSICRLFEEECWCLEEIRYRMGIIMPEEVDRFAPYEHVLDIVLSALRGTYGRTGDMRFRNSEKKLAEKILNQLGCSHLMNRDFGQLSSGEKRRTLIARALIHEPEVIVLDEPTTALDFAGKMKLIHTMRQIMQAGTSLVLVTHDPCEIPPEINRVILIKNGEILADGGKREILSAPLLSELYQLELSVNWSEDWPSIRTNSGHFSI